MNLQRRHFVLLPFVALSAAAAIVRAQEPPPSPPPDPAPPQTESSTKSKHVRHLDAFLVRGTVYDEKALSLPGAQLRVKRHGEKKYRWSTVSNSRGEFAIRIPPGSDYELLTQAKDFTDHTTAIDAKNQSSQDNMVIHMERPSERKK
jgi:Carboxypeptidase regulatory-like domain